MRMSCAPSTSRSLILHVFVFPEPRRLLHASHRVSQSLYDVLGVKREATPKEIKAAYYDLSKLHHPDTAAENKEDAAKRFQAISEAYETLSNDHKRKEYDRTLIKKRSQSTNVSRYWRDYPYKEEDGTPPDFDMDYRNFVEFRRKWRKKQRVSRQWHAPPEYWSEGYRQYEAFYPRKPPELRKGQWREGEYFKFMDEAERVQREYQRRRPEEFRKVNRDQEEVRVPRTPTLEELQRDMLRREEKLIGEKLGASVVVCLGTAIVILLLTSR